MARSSPRAPLSRPSLSSVPLGLRGGYSRQGHSDAQTFVTKELFESSLPPPSSGSSVFAIDLRPHEGTKTGGYNNGNAPRTEKTSVFGPCVVVVVRTCVYDKHVYPCNDGVYTPTNAPNYGGRVPVDTAPGPVPVYRALKNLPVVPAVKTDSWNLSLRQHSDVHQRR